MSVPRQPSTLIDYCFDEGIKTVLWRFTLSIGFFSYLGIKQKIIEELLIIYRSNDSSEMLQTFFKKKRKEERGT